jgi:hypothetical protein
MTLLMVAVVIVVVVLVVALLGRPEVRAVGEHVGVGGDDEDVLIEGGDRQEEPLLRGA